MIIKFKKLNKINKKHFKDLYFNYLEEILNKKIERDKIKFNIFLKRADFYILIYYNTIACFCSVYKNLKDKNIYIRDLYTIPKYRNKGLSKRMFNEILVIAKGIRAHKIKIDIIRSNRKIISYWNNLSFKKKSKNYELELNDSH